VVVTAHFVEGVTDSNKDLVCDAFAKEVGGTVVYCGFSKKFKRRMLTSTSLYMHISVSDASVAVATVKEPKFKEKVALPSGVTITSLSAKKTTRKVCPPNSTSKNGVCYCKHDRTLLASGTNCPESTPVKSATPQQSANMCFMAVLLLLGFVI